MRILADEPSGLVVQKYIDNVSEEVIHTVDKSALPVPDVDELVYFGEVDITGDGDGDIDDAEFSSLDGGYVVVERIFEFDNAEISREDTSDSAETDIAMVSLYVEPADEYENSDGE